MPIFNPDVCTGCMECALVCPDAAIPNSVHDIHELLLTAIDSLDITEAQRRESRLLSVDKYAGFGVRVGDRPAAVVVAR